MCPLHCSRKFCCSTLGNSATGGDIPGRAADAGRPLKPEVGLATAARVPEDEAGNERNAICDGKSISALIPND